MIVITAGQRPQNTVVSAIAGRKVRNGPVLTISSSRRRAATAADHSANATSQRIRMVWHRANRHGQIGDAGEASAAGQDAIRSMVTAVLLCLRTDGSFFYRTAPPVATGRRRSNQAASVPDTTTIT